MIMTILIGIILIFVGIGFYSAADRNGITNEWLCMLGMTMDGTM